MTTWTDTAVKPRAWLCGWVDTDSPGYRKVSIGGTEYTVTADYQRWPDYLSDVNTAVSAASWSASMSAQGQVMLAGSSAALVWTDRLGWLCGMATDPTDTPGTVTAAASIIPPPACIPLLSATWDSVDRQAEQQIQVDRWQRGHGYVWGNAELWRFTLRMVESAAHSLHAGHCLSGKVTLTGETPDTSWSDSAWSSSNPTGYLDGYVVGLEGGRWVGPSREIYECTLLVAAGVGS